MAAIAFAPEMATMALVLRMLMLKICEMCPEFRAIFKDLNSDETEGYLHEILEMIRRFALTPETLRSFHRRQIMRYSPDKYFGDDEGHRARLTNISQKLNSFRDVLLERMHVIEHMQMQACFDQMLKVLLRPILEDIDAMRVMWVVASEPEKLRILQTIGTASSWVSDTEGRLRRCKNTHIAQSECREYALRIRATKEQYMEEVGVTGSGSV